MVADEGGPPVWHDPHGGYSLVDHTGTRRLPGHRFIVDISSFEGYVA